MEIPLNAKVYCQDGPAGHLTGIIVDPDTFLVSHIVVTAKWAPLRDHLVPLKMVSWASPDAIDLACSRNDLVCLPRFTKTSLIRVRIPDYRHLPAQASILPQQLRYVDREVLVRREYIPDAKEAIHRGACVEATNGYVGVVEEFLVDTTGGHLTHIVIRRGHLWRKQDILIAADQIKLLADKTIYLKLNKASVKNLPTLPTLKQRDRYAPGRPTHDLLWGLS